MFDNKTITQLFKDFNNQKVLIIGDIMLDSYIRGKVERLSPEAPVPIVTVEYRENRLGGAANVAINVKSLGAKAIVCSVIGSDTKGIALKDTMRKAGLVETGIIESNMRKTTVKSRIIGNKTQMLRVDEETTELLNKHEYNELTQRIKLFCETENINVIIFQDYDKGVISPDLINFVSNLAKKHHIPIAVDPKKRNFSHYKEVALIKPNLKELLEGLNIANIKTQDEIAKATAELQKLLNVDIVLNTLSEKGIFVRWKEQNHHKTYSSGAHVRSIADVSGAGDTVISVASLCLSQKIAPYLMAELSNLAGGLVCEEVGVVPINKQKLLDEAIKFFSKQLIKYV